MSLSYTVVVRQVMPHKKIARVVTLDEFSIYCTRLVGVDLRKECI